jgi:hypothetical protein
MLNEDRKRMTANITFAASFLTLAEQTHLTYVFQIKGKGVTGLDRQVNLYPTFPH